MDNGAGVEKVSRREGGTMDTEIVTGKKNSAKILPDVHKGATEDKVIAVPAPADPELFEDEPRQG
jgi:hypothetical protein